MVVIALVIEFKNMAGLANSMLIMHKAEGVYFIVIMPGLTTYVEICCVCKDAIKIEFSHRTRGVVVNGHRNKVVLVWRVLCHTCDLNVDTTKRKRIDMISDRNTAAYVADLMNKDRDSITIVKMNGAMGACDVVPVAVSNVKVEWLFKHVRSREINTFCDVVYGTLYEDEDEFEN